MGTAYEYATGRDPDEVGSKQQLGTTRPGKTPASATLIDIDGTRRVYRLADERGYTHHYETILIRVDTRDGRGRYVVETRGAGGWHQLLGGDLRHGTIPYNEAVQRAFRVLMGEEDHG